MSMNTNQNNLIDRLTIDSKSILAKLMASENFTVEHHENAQTAYFDTRNRVLVLPMWENVSEELYNMLVGHEVGHALFTPTNAVRDGINYIDPANQEAAKDFWNIVEDARIERLIKDKFPGLRRDFSRAYKEIYSSDRFGLNTLLKNPEKMHTIDKLNLKAKLGVHADATVDLTKDEQMFYDRMMSTETHDEVLVLAKEIYEFCKNQMKQRQPQNQSGNSQESDDSSESNGKSGKSDSNQSAKSQSNGNSQNQGNEGNQQNSGSGNSDNSENSGDTSDNIASPYDMNSEERTLDEEEIENLDNRVQRSSGSNSSSNSKSVTVSVPRSDLSKLEEMARSNQNASGEDNANDPNGNKNSSNKVIGVIQALAGEQNTPVPNGSASMGQYTQFINSLPSRVKDGVVYYDLPTLDSDKVIVPFKKVMEDFSVLNKLGQSYFDHIHSKFMAETKDWINNAVMEFDRRKAADAHARTSIAKTGALNTSKLQNYKFSEDLFKRVSVTKNGKNHGIVMIIDWSGSMDCCMGSTIKQLLNLVMFCRKTSIPFEVYAFSDGYNDGSKYGANSVPNLGSKCPSIQYCRLINFLSYKMNSIEMKTMFNYLLHISQTYNKYDYFRPSEMSGSHPSMVKTMASIPHQYALNGTPLNTSILYSFDLLKKFQKKTGVQIMNYVVLTDGEDSYGFATEYGKTTVLRDKATKNQVAFKPGRNGGSNGPTSCILNMLRKNVGCSAVGYYLIPSSNGKAILASLMGIAADTNEGRKKLDAEVEKFKKDHHAVVTNAGYDSYFIIPSDQMNQAIDKHDTALSKNVTGGLVDMSKAKKNRRIILTKFIDIISKQIKDSYHENLKSKL